MQILHSIGFFFFILSFSFCLLFVFFPLTPRFSAYELLQSAPQCQGWTEWCVPAVHVPVPVPESSDGTLFRPPWPKCLQSICWVPLSLEVWMVLSMHWPLFNSWKKIRTVTKGAGWAPWTIQCGDSSVEWIHWTEKSDRRNVPICFFQPKLEGGNSMHWPTDKSILTVKT